MNLIVFFNCKVFSQKNKVKEELIRAKVIVNIYVSNDPFNLRGVMDYRYSTEILPYCYAKNRGIYIIDGDNLITNGLVPLRIDKTIKLPDINFINKDRKFLKMSNLHLKYPYKASFVLNAKWIKYNFPKFKPNEASQKALYLKSVDDTLGGYNYYILKDTISTKNLTYSE